MSSLSLFWCFMGRLYGAIGLLRWGYVARKTKLPNQSHQDKGTASEGEGKHQKRDDVIDDAQINQDKFILKCISDPSEIV